MRAGVLIAGSLIWDDHPMRVSWRNNRLRVERRESVPAPIRYGRLSSSRSNTYTMVFSTECVEDGVGTGRGMAVPFKRDPESASDLVCEANELWRIERKADSEARGVISARWGSVGLAVRPDFGDREQVEQHWAEAVLRSPHYGSLATLDHEASAVDQQTGLAGFDWSAVATEAVRAFDVLLFTATKASIADGRYPAPEVIAEAWRAAPLEAAYFRRNRDWGILTREDDLIEDLLGDVMNLC